MAHNMWNRDFFDLKYCVGGGGFGTAGPPPYKKN